jgi:hypothetical protein
VFRVMLCRIVNRCSHPLERFGASAGLSASRVRNSASASTCIENVGPVVCLTMKRKGQNKALQQNRDDVLRN